MSMTPLAKDMTTQEYAAIHLGVPDSGDFELDAMIRKANRMGCAKAVMQCVVTQSDQHASSELVSGWALELADALLAALEAKP